MHFVDDLGWLSESSVTVAATRRVRREQRVPIGKSGDLLSSKCLSSRAHPSRIVPGNWRDPRRELPIWNPAPPGATLRGRHGLRLLVFCFHLGAAFAQAPLSGRRARSPVASRRGCHGHRGRKDQRSTFGQIPMTTAASHFPVQRKVVRHHREPREDWSARARGVLSARHSRPALRQSPAGSNAVDETRRRRRRKSISRCRAWRQRDDHYWRRIVRGSSPRSAPRAAGLHGGSGGARTSAIAVPARATSDSPPCSATLCHGSGEHSCRWPISEIVRIEVVRLGRAHSTALTPSAAVQIIMRRGGAPMVRAQIQGGTRATRAFSSVPRPARPAWRRWQGGSSLSAG